MINKETKQIKKIEDEIYKQLKKEKENKVFLVAELQKDGSYKFTEGSKTIIKLLNLKI